MAAGSLTVTARPQGAVATDSGAARPPGGWRSSITMSIQAMAAVVAKAEFTNTGDMLWPGAIINVVLPLGAASTRIVLPEAAVQTGRDAPFVWAVGKDGKVAMRDVAVAGRADGKVYLASGVAPGEQIVTDALTKLKPGDTVRTRAGSKGSGPGQAPRTAMVTDAATAVGG